MKRFFTITAQVAGLLIILVLAGVLRYRAVQLLPPDYDEDDYLRAGQLYADGIRRGDWGVFLRENYRSEHPPLAKIVYGFSLLGIDSFPPIADRPVDAPIAQDIPEQPLRVARSAAALLNLVEVAVLAILNPLAGLFTGIHTFTIKYTSQVMLESLPALTSLLVVVFYMRYFKMGRKKSLWWILSAVSLGLTAASKYYFCLSGVAVAIHWLWNTRQRNNKLRLSQFLSWLAPLLGWGAVAMLVFLAADPYLWADPIGQLKESVFFHGGYAASAQVREAGYPWWQPLNWLMISVPWHPGVFLIPADILITVLAVTGISRMRQKYPVYLLWLGIGLGFLLVWPTKWPQYILLIGAPLSLAAAEGFKEHIAEPFSHWLPKLFRKKPNLTIRRRYDPAGRVLPWLLPGLIALALIALVPLIYQIAISMTDFQSSAIRDGVNGGVFREVWLGITGQVEPNLDALGGGRPSKVHYAGLYLLRSVLFGSGPAYVFELIWTVLAVGLQLLLGIGVALLLHRKGILFGRLWKTLFILPWAIPEFVAALAWSQIFTPRFGWLSLAAKSWPYQAPAVANLATALQQNPDLQLALLLIAGLWYGFPFMFLSTLAGLKMIPAEVYDAAAIDGASGWSLFRHVTWPLVFPLLAPAIIIRAIFAFNQFYLFMVMNSPGSTFAASSYLIFRNGNYAVSAGINIVVVLILILLVRWFNRWSKASEGVTYA